MRKTILILFIALTSCLKPKYELEIIKYVENTDGITTDLNVKFIKTEDLTPYKAKDSLKILNKLIKDNIEVLRKDSDSHLKMYSKLYPNALLRAEIEKNPKTIEADKKHLENIKEIMKIYGDVYMKIMEKDYKGVSPFVDVLLSRVEKLNDTSKVLMLRKNVTYSIVNPYLNNAKQTKSELFYLLPKSFKVVMSKKIEVNN